MPTCSKCHPVRDLGISCPHQGPGLALWEQGRAAGRAEVAVGLTDLIAELVGDDGDGHAITADGDDDCSVCQMIDRAEARLKGINDE